MIAAIEILNSSLTLENPTTSRDEITQNTFVDYFQPISKEKVHFLTQMAAIANRAAQLESHMQYH